jgi:N-acetylneuraminic acid mutarotase
MFSRISKFFIICIMLTVIGIVHQVAAAEVEAGTWTRKADMPTPKHWPCAAVVDGKIYVIAGGPPGAGHSRTVHEYNPATDTWTRRADKPTSVHALGGAAVDGIIYTVGGWNDIGLHSVVEAYDPAADKWTRRVSVPTSRSGISNGVVAVDGKIYVIGGQLYPKVLSNVDVYDPETDKWTRKADMPTPRFDHAACVIDGKIYVSGGNPVWPRQAVPLSTVDIYDPATDTWSQGTDMPRTRTDHSASVVDGKMYIIGGVDPEVIDLYLEGELDLDEVDELFAIVDVYDPKTDTWTTVAELPQTREGHITNVVDGKIYVIGGSWGPDWTAVYEVDEFDPGLPSTSSSVSPAGKLIETWGHIKKVQ